jgi:thiol:disulfide interchange protein
MRIWRNHSLTIVLTVLGCGLTALAIWLVWPLELDRWFDILSGLGAGLLTVALFNLLSGPLREKNKPEL